MLKLEVSRAITLLFATLRQLSEPCSVPHQRGVPVDSNLVSGVALDVVDVAELWLTALQVRVGWRICGILVGTSGKRSERLSVCSNGVIWEERGIPVRRARRVLIVARSEDAAVDELGEFGAVSDDVRQA